MRIREVNVTDSQVRWVYNDAYLEVIRPKTNGILASWRFGKDLKDNQTSVVAVTDIKTQAGLLLIVATSNMSDVGAIHIFSIKLRKVIRFIEVPKRISALEVVFANETEDISSWIISKHLRFFSGLLAVGTEGGYIFLIDLCLDSLDVGFASELAPRKLMVITPRIVDPVAKREEALTYDKHLALLLDDQCHRQEQFYYRRQDDTVQKVFEEDTIWVSRLTYIAQSGTLAVGFNFGCFQLWRLYNPVLDYSSRYSPDSPAVSNFLVQEPENDPRNFVYLWVVFDNPEEESSSNVCLYQLSYLKKDTYANFGIFYDDLESVCPRLDHNLTVDPYSTDKRGTSRSTVISCYTLKNSLYTPPAVLSDSFEDGFHGNDLSLSVFVWRADKKQGGRGSAASCYWMSIFDINRWYHAQMPHALRCHGASLQVCSFWAVYDLDEVVAQLPSQVLLNVEISGEKVLRFTNNMPVPPEEHSYPSALQLAEVNVVLANGIVQAQCRGWQGQLLREMILRGAEYLVQPADFYHQCLRARLLPQSFEEGKIRSTDYQRKMLLNMALEWGRAPALIPQCIKLWEDEGCAEQGCSLTLLLNWAWESVITTKNSFDTACTMLYDWSELPLDQRTDWQIAQLTQTLSHIRQIFTYFTVQAPPTTERGQFELELRQQVVSILLQHCEVVRWAISFSLLPENDEASEPMPGLFAFPASELRQAYKNRRAELGSMKGTISGLSLLLIDCLVECQGPHIRQVWESRGGDGTYPPPSMQAMMNMYLIEEVSIELKHALMLYFLQDLAMLDRSAEREAAVASFIQRFMLSPSLVHQVQGLWFIDHRDYEEGVRHLVNANVHEDLCESWSHVAVVNTLLAQGQGRMATCYMHTKPALGESFQEKQLYISVLMDNRQVSQAVDFLRGCCEEERAFMRLMGHLLKECQSHKLLGQLLQLNLTEWEESALEAHLRARPEPHALEPLLLYYLHRSRFLQAFRLNQDMNMRDKLETSLASQERSVSRNKLMEAYLKVLPEVTRKMLTEKQTAQAVVTSARRIQLDRPKPLSTIVRQADFAGMSQAKFIMAVIDKIKEATTMLIDEDEEEEQHKARGIGQDGFDGDLEFDIPFLSTPRTPKRMSMRRKSESIFKDTGFSPLVANSPSLSARKTLSILKSVETQEEKNSLKQLASECLQVLQTPVRDHKRKSLSPGKASQIPVMKTPQSILKVRRLSKTLPSSREKLSSRRNSGSRSMRLTISKSDTSHNASSASIEKQSPSSTTPLSATDKLSTIGAAIATVTPKQLRFIGISPSPTPSPSVASLNASQESERSEEVVQAAAPSISRVTSLPSFGEQSSDVSKVIEVTNDVLQEETESSKEKEPTEAEIPMDQSEALSSSSDKQDTTAYVHVDTGPHKADEQDTTGYLHVGTGYHRADKRDATEYLEVDTGQHREEEEIPSFEEGPEDRYSEELKVLVRPDLQSPWKQHSPELVYTEMDKDTNLGVRPTTEETPSNSSSPVLVKADLRIEHTGEQDIQEKWIGRQVAVAQVSEKVNISMSREMLSTSSVHKQIVVETSASEHEERSRVTEDLAAFSKTEDFPKPSSPVRVHRKPSESPKASPKSASERLLSIQVETSTLPTSGKPEDSPPATPPSSKRAKMMVTKDDDTDGLVEVVPRAELPPTPQRETRRKTPERRAMPVALNTEELLSSSLSSTKKVETRRKTPERKSPWRNQREIEDFAGETPEKRSSSVKAQELSEEKELSTLKTRRKTPERRSPARKVTKTLGSDLSEKHDSEKGRDEDGDEKFTNAENVIERMEEPDLPSEVPARRRSARLNTPDRSVAEPAGVKSVRDSKHRGKTPSKQGVQQELSKGDDKFFDSEKVLGDDAEAKSSPEIPVRRYSRRLNTPDRSVADVVEGKKSARISKQRGKTPQRSDVESESSSLEKERETPVRQSTRKLQASGQLSNVDKIAEEEEPVPMELQRPKQESQKHEKSVAADVGDQAQAARKSKRQSKTPDRLLDEDAELVQVRRSRRQSKTPDRLLSEDSRLTSVRETRRFSKTPDRILSERVSEPAHDSESDAVEQADNVSLRRSRRQSKTPDRQPVRKSVEPLTPTRRSRRHHKTPEVLNTDEIEPLPVGSPSVSPRRAVKKALVEPATPPKMSVKEVDSLSDKFPPMKSESTKQLSDASTQPGETAPVAETEVPLTPTRRSARRAKSLERLNTDQIQPVSPHTSPARSKLQHSSSEAEEQTEKQSSKTEKSSIPTHASKDKKTQPAKRKNLKRIADGEVGVAVPFIFSPPLRHKLGGHDVDSKEADSQQHHFVFSNPSVLSPPEKKEESQPEKRKRKKFHKLYVEDEVKLLSPLPTPHRLRGRPRKQLSDTQRAAAKFLKRTKQTPPKSRRLVPSVKKSPIKK
ncbi:At hook containing transcription factor 1 [Plakobranchus ocellatus]|uniref:At hook containing transcription factor 1 n=1 Tax=Plakobranchus ocellatus TaxID=259542 RepID=A0AAV4A160_9GAST|nr:At hook containing transcription factor 1 [Plakobranchus ocellatus]